MLQNIDVQLIASKGNCADTTVIENISFSIPQLGNIPNIITPNNDALNDCFRIKELEPLFGCASLTIFDRWGLIVYEDSTFIICWDGKNQKNKELSSGVYFYQLKIRDTQYNGIVHLIR